MSRIAKIFLGSLFSAIISPESSFAEMELGSETVISLISKVTTLDPDGNTAPQEDFWI